MANHQVKSRWYYIFWFSMAVAVCSGQYYVGSGYREMAAEQRAFARSVYDSQMGWNAYQTEQEVKANRKLNKTGEFE